MGAAAPFEVKSLATAVRKSDSGAMVFRITSQSFDREKDRVRTPDALKVESFQRNPVLLWNHDDTQPAIGTARVYREGDEWLMEPQFDRIGQLSKDVADKVEAGTLRTCSIKFLVLRYERNEAGGLDYLEIELLEVSITNIPCNTEAERVKNATSQKNDATPTEPTTPASAKALDADTAAAFKAMLDEALKPHAEALERIEKFLTGLTGGEPAEAPSPEDTAGKSDEEPAPDAPAKDKAAEEDEGIEMTDEESEEMKAFFKSFAPPPAPRA